MVNNNETETTNYSIFINSSNSIENKKCLFSSNLKANSNKLNGEFFYSRSLQAVRPPHFFCADTSRRGPRRPQTKEKNYHRVLHAQIRWEGYFFFSGDGRGSFGSEVKNDVSVF
jgi:hypothetical protein